MALASELRCLVCQNQTIADSSAGLAIDLRAQIRQMLQDGRNEAEIFEYMTQRYGDFVLYRPPVKSTTALLWAGPVLLLVGGLFGLWQVLRRRQALGDEAFEEGPVVEDDGDGPPDAAAQSGTSRRGVDPSSDTDGGSTDR
jgi:cytochrome c-type biogenesis protein CcmH